MPDKPIAQKTYSSAAPEFAVNTNYPNSKENEFAVKVDKKYKHGDNYLKKEWKLFRKGPSIKQHKLAKFIQVMQLIGAEAAHIVFSPLDKAHNGAFLITAPEAFTNAEKKEINARIRHFQAAPKQQQLKASYHKLRAVRGFHALKQSAITSIMDEVAPPKDAEKLSDQKNEKVGNMQLVAQQEVTIEAQKIDLNASKLEIQQLKQQLAQIKQELQPEGQQEGSDQPIAPQPVNNQPDVDPEGNATQFF